MRLEGLALVQGVGKEAPPWRRKAFDQHAVPRVNDLWPDATLIPTSIGGSLCHRTVPIAKPRELMGWSRGSTETKEGTADALCLRVTDPPGRLKEAYVTFEFYETEPGWIAVQYAPKGETGFVHHVCTWDTAEARDHTWVNTTDTNTWQKGIVRLAKPQFAGKGPFGADIRFVSSGPIYLRKVTISSASPDDFDGHGLLAHARRIEEFLRPRYPEPAGPISVGNMGTGFESANPLTAYDVTPWLPLYKAMRFSSIQSYVMWRFVEKKKGVWDWTLYDWVVREAKRFGMKWVAFIPIGPWYSLPYWFIDSPDNHRNKCLEHDEESWVQSIWSPVMLRYVRRFFREFARHYDERDIESIMLGPSGDYGETTTNGTFLGKNYHTHEGHWCGEELAVRNFRRAMRDKHGSIEKLNAAWGTRFRRFSELRPLRRDRAPSDRMWLDQLVWYVGRETWWTHQWAEIVRKALPNTVVYMAVGGPGDPPHAGHWTDQTRAIRHTGIGARVTNEGGDYAHNFAYTSWQATCCRFYNTPFGNEPWGGDMCGAGDLGRMYNAITRHATNLWFYESHVRPPAGHRAIERGLPFMNGRYRRTTRIAVYYPWTYFAVRNEHGFGTEGPRDIFWPQVEELRDIIDFDLVDDGVIRDGIMRDYDFLIVLQGTVYERDELERVVSWLEGGGIVITHNIGVPTTVEGDLGLGRKLLAFDGKHDRLGAKLGARIASVGKGRTLVFPHCANRKGWYGDWRWERVYRDHPATHPGFWRMITNTLASASALGTGLLDHPIIDGERDGVFGALVEHDSDEGILYFSQIERDVVKRPRIPGGRSLEVVVPAGRILFVPFRDAK